MKEGLWFLLIFGGLWPAGGLAATASTRADPDRIDPFLRVGAPRDLEELPPVRPSGELAALVRAPTGRSWTEELERTVTARGLRFRLNSHGDPVDVGGIRAVDGPRARLRELAEEGWTVRVARSLSAAHGPTAVTGPLSELDALVASGGSPVGGPLGAGMTVLDVDTSIDPFHPHFFRADAGVAIWLDVDGDEILTPGVDGIDLDGDGELAPDEVLRLANSRRIWTDVASYAEREDGADATLDPSRDWLWLDADGNGVRDYGPDAGYHDDDPGFGEPIYAPDDVDGDGVIRVPERLLQLGSSRIVAVSTGARTYRRGVDLTELYSLPAYDAAHGTGVGGVLVGGQLYPQPRPRGLLPEADLYMLDRSFTDEAEQLVALAAALEEGVDVVLWEYGRWIGDHLDGSNMTEQMIDAMSADGITQVCPAGNLATSGKHGVTTSIDGRLTFHFRVSPWSEVTSFWLDLHANTPDERLTCVLSAPSGETLDVSWSGYALPFDGMTPWSTRWVSPRDATLWSLMLSSGVLEPGTWVMRCETASSDPLTVHAYLADGSGWGRGTVFLQETDKSTLTLPSTADSCISVAAFGGDQEYWNGEQPGERHLYSSMGPRIDGGKTIDIAAPADPFTPSPLRDEEGGATDPVYRRFGGTSGAGPHVAAAAVLLQELNPDLSGTGIRQLIRDGARVDSFVSADASEFPADDWGYGKLSAYRSAFGEPPPTPPSAPREVLTFLQAASEGDRCIVRATGLVPGMPSASFRWDLGYDGEWSGGFSGEPFEFDVIPDDVLVLRVQAAVDGWWVGGRAQVWRAPKDCPDGQGCTACSMQESAPSGPLVGWLLVVGWLRRRRAPRPSPRSPPAA